MTPGLMAIAAYLALQLGIGVWIARRIRNESDYLLAGRSLGYTFATFSIFATWFGSETVVGSAGKLVPRWRCRSATRNPSDTDCASS
jgi:Na+/proline symporter